MRKTALFVLFFGFCSSAFALDFQTFRDPKIQSSYDQLRTKLETRYQNAYPLSDAQLKNIANSEATIITAYRKLE